MEPLKVSAVDGSSNSKTNVQQLAAYAHVPTSNTTYSAAVSAPSTTSSAAADSNGIENATIGGSKTTGNVLTITVHDTGLSGGTHGVSYTVLSGDTLPSIASGLETAINADTTLQAIGVSATVASKTINISSNSVNSRLPLSPQAVVRQRQSPSPQTRTCSKS